MAPSNRQRPGWRPGATWLLAPALAFFGLVFLFPLARLVVVSFQSSTGPLGHYERAFKIPAYLYSLQNTVEIALTVSALCLLLAYPTAIILSTASKRVRLAFGALIVLPHFVAVLVRTYAVMVVLGTHGPINNLLLALGIVDVPQRMVFTRWAVIGAMTLVLLPVTVLPMASVMSRIDPNLTRAAQSLGAGPIAAFWRVFFPLSLPGTLAGLILVFVLSLGFFITPALIGGPKDRVIAIDIANQATLLTSEGFTEALAVILLLVTLGILAAASRFVRFDLIWGMAGGLTARQIVSPGAGARGRRALWSIREALADRVGWPLLRVLGSFPPAVGFVVMRSVALFVAVCVIVPISVVIVVSFTSSAFLSFPPSGYSFRWYGEFFSSKAWVQASLNSVIIGVLTAGFSLVVGTCAAFGLARSRIRGKGMIVAFLLSPLIVPSVVGASSLYWMLLRFDLTGTIPAIVAAHALGAIPMVVLIVSATYQTFDPRLEQAAQSLGASPWRALVHVTLPLVRPGLIAATLFAFLHSFDELVYTLFVRGPRFVTLPIKLWGDLNFGITPVLAVVSAIEIAVVVTILMAVAGVGAAGPRRRGATGSAELEA
jgi:putative spermidine/putrescine transport system permease protein